MVWKASIRNILLFPIFYRENWSLSFYFKFSYGRILCNAARFQIWSFKHFANLIFKNQTPDSFQICSLPYQTPSVYSRFRCGLFAWGGISELNPGKSKDKADPKWHTDRCAKRRKPGKWKNKQDPERRPDAGFTRSRWDGFYFI